MITWTVTTRPDHHRDRLIASGAEPNLEQAKQCAADAVRYALLGAADTTRQHGTPPTYLVTIDGTCALIVGIGACQPANYNGVLDALEHFDGTATNLLYL